MTVLEERPLSELDHARQALADEWRERDPKTPEEIAAFYRTAEGMGDDLDAWHKTPERQLWTNMVTHVAKASGTKVALDIGCGAGYELAALRVALPGAELHGVEPNRRLRVRSQEVAFVTNDLRTAPVETADLLLCLDVLEHLPDPEAFLSEVAGRARLGALLIEATATHDHGTPLHLESNYGWHAGRCLEQHGWKLIDHADRIHVWRRDAEAARQTSSLLLCAYRGVAPITMQSIIGLTAGDQELWRFRAKTGDSLIARSRSIITTSWWRETGDDTFLMVDDDVVFAPSDCDRIVELCRNGYDVICGAYPTHDGTNLALRTLPNTTAIEFGMGPEPVRMPIEVDYAATGFMAVHRRVIDAMVKELPLCHRTETWSFYPFFQSMAVDDERIGWMFLSEDWGFSRLARQLGFKVWLDPQALLQHSGSISISVRNMEAVHNAIGQA